MTCLGVSTDTDTGIQVTVCEALQHSRPYCGPRVWRSFSSDLGSRVFEAPFASLIDTIYMFLNFPTVESTTILNIQRRHLR